MDEECRTWACAQRDSHLFKLLFCLNGDNQSRLSGMREANERVTGANWISDYFSFGSASSFQCSHSATSLFSFSLGPVDATTITSTTAFMVYYHHLSTRVIAHHPDGPDEEVHFLCYSLLQTSDQPIARQHLLVVRSGRPAGVQAERDWRSSRCVMECASVYELWWTLSDVHSAPCSIYGVGQPPPPSPPIFHSLIPPELC